MKGDRKRIKSQFCKGHTPWNKGLTLESEETESDSTPQIPRTVTRMSAEDFSLVTKSRLDGTGLSTPDCEGISTSVRLLRPTAASMQDLKQESSKDDLEGMRLVDNEKVAEAWNTALRLHRSTSTDCDDPQLQIAKERKWGACWKVTLKCVVCDFTAPEMKLYKEIKTGKPGPNPAAPNVGLALGLQDTPIGNTRARLLMANMDIPPPCRSSMQRTSNKVAIAVTELNTQDMAEKVELVKEVNRKRGTEPCEMNIAMDGRYNSTTIASRKKPGQNASQAIGIACETVTDKKFIIGASFQNKLCWTGAWLKGKGMDVKCPGGHPDCTANMSAFAPFSEFNMGEDIGNQLALQGVLIKYATTDGDSKSAEGIDQALKVLDPMWKVQRLADPTHLAQGQFRQCYRADFNPDMFPGTTRTQKLEAKKVLSQDVKARCSLILKELMKDHAGDMKALRSILPRVLEATLKCYSGDCSRCAWYSVVCRGGVTNSWWQRSMFLGCNKITHFNMDDNDKHLLNEILKMKLSVEVVEQMKLYTDTQKCEAVNRSMSISLPKNVNFSRNMIGRASSTIHRLNNGPGTSAIDKCQNSGVELSSRAVRSLEQMDKEAAYHKEYQKSPSVVKRKLVQHGSKISEHLKSKLSDKQRGDYKKGQLDPVPCFSKQADHSYSKK
ncbi:uncharacterized protein [Haliotis cracherodii]|uniref:uncharacterized protein n=1 Tax=Haliotis cracherodii TaxID=6455 RepID=UPI0039E9CFD2